MEGACVLDVGWLAVTVAGAFEGMDGIDGVDRAAVRPPLAPVPDTTQATLSGIHQKNRQL